MRVPFFYSSCAEGVILAAGLSSRMGTYKMSLRLGNKTILEKCIEGMNDFCFKITVVGGHNFHNISELASKYHKVEMLYNDDYEEGMFSSVRFGLKNTTAYKVLITPGDYPFIKKATYIKLIESHGKIIVPKFQNELGHPVMLEREAVDMLIDCKECLSLKQFIDSFGYKAVDVNDAGILIDIDTAEDYKNAAEYARSGRW